MGLPHRKIIYKAQVFVYTISEMRRKEALLRENRAIFPD